MANTTHDEKLGELIVYIAAKCERHTRFGATKLNKILFYADFISYVQRGRSITGADYQRLDHGPAPVRLVPVEAALINSGAVLKQPSFAPGGYTEKRLIPLRAANLSLFDAEDISTVDHVIEVFEHHSAQEISELSHRLPCWKFAKTGEIIPYFTALLPEVVGPLSKQDRDWANSVVARYEAQGA